MRIISGSARGRRLATPSGSRVRPTSDRVRESLFSILGSVSDAVFLDAFAGSGAVGCEALSRGASHVYFLDAHRDSISLIEDNVSRVRARERASVHRTDASRGLSLLSHTLDFVFLDPPYDQDPTPFFTSLSSSPHLSPHTLIVLEQDRDSPLPSLPDFLLDDERTYGRARLTFWLPKDSPS